MEQGWDQFLTVRDKEHLAIGLGARTPHGLGERPAVIVVDDYYAAVGVERLPLFESMKTWPGSCGLEGWAAIDRTAELLSSARAVKLPIIYTKNLAFPSPWAPSGPAMPKGDAPGEPQPDLGNEIVAELAPQPGDLVIEKAAPSGFAGTALDFHLTYLQVDSLIICGESTSGCVRATVVDATTHRYKVTVVEDCCFDRTEASHWINLFDMQQKYADVVTLSEIRHLLEHRRADV